MTGEHAAVYKTCNVNAEGCCGKYNLTERAEKELSKQRKQKSLRPRYESKYDACDNELCQKGVTP